MTKYYTEETCKTGHHDWQELYIEEGTATFMDRLKTFFAGDLYLCKKCGKQERGELD